MGINVLDVFKEAVPGKALELGKLKHCRITADLTCDPEP